MLTWIWIVVGLSVLVVAGVAYAIVVDIITIKNEDMDG